jgi:hypothetical protein
VVDCLLYLRKRLQELLLKRLKAPAYIASDVIFLINSFILFFVGYNADLLFLNRRTRMQ